MPLLFSSSYERNVAKPVLFNELYLSFKEIIFEHRVPEDKNALVCWNVKFSTFRISIWNAF